MLDKSDVTSFPGVAGIVDAPDGTFVTSEVIIFAGIILSAGLRGGEYIIQL
jgi:hypothetical protein